jgi:RNA polymerase sigma-70 factor (ECF subfamily)
MNAASPPAAPDDAFVRALTDCQSVLRGYCQSSLGPGEDAKDAWQRTNLVLWRKAADWQPDTKFLPWALAVARFEVLAVIRDRQRERLIFDDDVVELMAEEGMERAMEADPRSDALASCLDRLQDHHRQMLFAHYVTGSSLAEIADTHGKKEGAVKVLLLRVRRALAECIEKLQPREVGT